MNQRPATTTSPERIRLTKDGRVYFKGIRKYGNGDVYDGEFVDGMRHGVGKLKMGNNDRYEGEFERNLFHGFGVYIWSSDENDTNANTNRKNDDEQATRRYEGDWKDGKKHGRGVYHLGNGDVYSGSFAQDLYDGPGLLKRSTGESFDGQWQRGRPYGFMKISYANGDRYEGELCAGVYEGKGKITFRDGLGSYDGEWHVGKPHGKGNRIYADGGKFIGEFTNGDINGEGMMFFANGDQYLGHWKNGLMEGKGVYNYHFGDSYEGTFLRGVRYGEGRYRYKDGGYYQGEYLNVQKTGKKKDSGGKLPLCDGKRHGVGVRVWSTGARYEGQWVEDKIHGVGVLMSEHGAKYEGPFYNGLRNGKAKEQFGNTFGVSFVCPLNCKHPGNGFCVYTGNYRQGLFHGYGELQCISGMYYKGEWKQGKKHGQGEQYFVKNGELGDAHNLFIGGVDSLYRNLKYHGEFNEDERHGQGILTLTNGDTLEGNFRHGQPHGTIVCTFAETGKIRMAMFELGTRVSWAETRFRRSASRSSRGGSRSRSRGGSRSRSRSRSRSNSHSRPQSRANSLTRVDSDITFSSWA